MEWKHTFYGLFILLEWDEGCKYIDGGKKEKAR